MLDDVLAIPDHLRDALWRVESARLEPAEAAGVMVCGMGGSAIGGDLAAAVLGDRLTRPLVTIRGYELPSWATPEWTVLCSSYSGDTEETLACFEAAEALGMPERMVMRRIVLPQATRIVIPAIGNDFVAMIKDSSLVSIIAVPELLWKAEAAGRPNHAILPALLIAAVAYWGLTILFSFIQERIERRMARGDR